jgi:hypothetical protein
MVSPCDWISLEYLATYHLDHFVHHIQTRPQLICILSHPETIKLCNRLLAAWNPESSQYLNYDTSFDFGSFYVSFLVMKNTELVEEPIFPIACLVHNRKQLTTHSIFWDWMCNQLEGFCEVPLVTDRETSIVQAIEQKKHHLAAHFFCSLHIRRNAKMWCKRKGLESTFKSIKHDLWRLTNSESREDYEKWEALFFKSWPSEFVDYFTAHISTAIRSNISLIQTGRFGCFQSIEITSNLSENFHRTFQAYASSRLRLDQFALLFHQYQIHFLHQLNLAIDKLSATFHYKNQFLPKHPFEVPSNQFDSDTVLKHVKHAYKLWHQEEDIEQQDDLSEAAIASMAIKQGLVVFQSNFSSFFVGNPLKQYEASQVVIKNGMLTFDQFIV